ncbi:hypothetical protein FF1_015657 [Malus domestica]
MALSHLGGRRNNVFDPFSLDIWDPFEGFGALANIPSSARETTAIANTRIDWKETPEAYIFKVDLRGIKLKSFEFTPSKNLTLIHHQMALSHFGGRRNNVFNPFSLDIWYPFEGFDALANIPSSARETTVIANNFDWDETPEAYIVNKHLPGIKKEDVRLEVEDKKVLQIRKRIWEQVERVERSSGKLMGKVRLLENVKVDQVKAEMKAWVLIVTLPKEVKTPNVERIEIIEA